MQILFCITRNLGLCDCVGFLQIQSHVGIRCQPVGPVILTVSNVPVCRKWNAFWVTLGFDVLVNELYIW